MKMHNIASIEVEQDIIQANDKLASENRKKFVFFLFFFFHPVSFILSVLFLKSSYKIRLRSQR